MLNAIRIECMCFVVRNEFRRNNFVTEELRNKNLYIFAVLYFIRIILLNIVN